MSAADLRAALEKPSPVDATQIERALAAMWKTAGAEQGSGVVTRACLWNVIAHLEHRPDREGSTGVDEIARALEDLPQQIASRTLVLRTEVAAEGRPELESWISANCAVSPGGGYVCSEEITIVARGGGDRHLPSLVRALTVADVPTAAVFAALPAPEDRIAGELVHAVDRLITDADRSTLARPLSRLREIVKRRPLGGIDLGWLATQPIRARVADLFDRLGSGTLGALKRVTAVSAPLPSRRLILGWIAACLGAKRVLLADQDLVAELDGGRRLPLGIAAQTDGTDGLRFEIGGSVHYVPLSLEAASPTKWLARALSGRSEDSSFLRALEFSIEP